MPLRCPVCKAENPTAGNCRRCKADLSLLFALEEDRDSLLERTRLALSLGRYSEAQALASRADMLRQDQDSSQLVALTALLCGDHAQAWRYYLRVRSATSEDRRPPGRG
jgi:hypothetical protein